MLLFGLGTVPALAAVTFGLRKAALQDMRIRRLLAAAVLFAGLWSIGMRQGLIGGGPMMNHGAKDADMPAMEHDGQEGEMPRMQHEVADSASRNGSAPPR